MSPCHVISKAFLCEDHTYSASLTMWFLGRPTTLTELHWLNLQYPSLLKTILTVFMLFTYWLIKLTIFVIDIIMFTVKDQNIFAEATIN